MSEERVPADLIGAILRELNKKPERSNQNDKAAFYEKIFEAALEPIIVADGQGRIICVNEAFTRTFGYQQQEVKGEFIDSVVVPPELRKDSLAITSLVLRGQKVEQETWRQGRQGENIPVLLLAAPIMIEDRVAAIFVIYHDQRPVKNLEAKLRGAEERFLDIAQASTDWIWEVDKDWHYVFASSRVKPLLGYDPEEITGQSFYKLIPAGEMEKIKPLLNASSQKGQKIVDLECWHQNKTGERTLFLINAFPVKNERGELRGYRGLSRDITSRSLTEERLQKEMARFAAMIEGMQEGVLLADENNLIIEINNYFLKLLGQTRETVIGQSLFQFDPIAKLTDLDSLITRYKNDRQSQALTLERSLFNLEVIVRFQPIYYQNTYDGLIINLIDVSELVKARNQAQTAEKVKGEFLANISHEIRTPLNGILGMVNLFLETELTAEQKEYLKGIKDSAESLLSLIKDILDFSKIEEKKIELEKTSFSLIDLVFEAVAPLTHEAHKKKLELVCDLPPSLPEYVQGDPARLRQILINLLSNAVKFTEKGEVIIRVSLEEQEDDQGLFHFVIADTGIGIPKEKQELIFQAFTQADGSMTRRFGGTGLGLAITHELVTILGGKIWVESEVGSGSRFHVEVKLKLASSQESKITEEKEAREALKETTALIVDDNSASRHSVKAWLASWGIKAEETESGEDAIVLIERSLQLGAPFNFIIVDSSLPGTGSFFLQDFLRQEEDRARRTIVMLAASDHKTDISLWQKAGINAFVTKPVRPAELRDSLLFVLGKKKSIEVAGLKVEKEVEPAKTKYRILLAEDNLVNQKVACFILERHGHEVVAVKDGLEAVEAVAKSVFDLVLMDVQMPRMDGFAATREIRKKEKGTKGHLPIIAMTAHALKGDREKCLAAGMDDYVSKPLRADELLGVIERTVNKFKRKGH